MPDANLEILHGSVDWAHFLRVLVRLALAVGLGGAIGFERERERKQPGMRTHMLVALGSALFVLVPLEAGGDMRDVTRVIQGIAAGIGFLGAGSILKLGGEQEIKGLTTAASVWLTASIGIAVGGGWLWPAAIAEIGRAHV